MYRMRLYDITVGNIDPVVCMLAWCTNWRMSEATGMAHELEDVRSKGQRAGESRERRPQIQNFHFRISQQASSHHGKHSTGKVQSSPSLSLPVAPQGRRH